MTSRYAIYYAPEPDTALFRFARTWFGRDPITGEELQAGDVSELSHAEWMEAVLPPRMYGFHATLKPPFRLADGISLDRLAEAVAAFARDETPVALGALELAEIGKFLALVPKSRIAGVHDLADACVRVFDSFRAPAPLEETERRRRSGLSARQEEHLKCWGYPYVFDEFRFHMTLTGRLGDDVRPRAKAELDRRLRIVLEDAVTVDAITVFEQPEAGAPFQIWQRFPLEGNR